MRAQNIDDGIEPCREQEATTGRRRHLQVCFVLDESGKRRGSENGLVIRHLLGHKVDVDNRCILGGYGDADRER